MLKIYLERADIPLINLELAKVMEGMTQCLIPEASSKRRKNILPVQKEFFYRPNMRKQKLLS